MPQGCSRVALLQPDARSLEGRRRHLPLPYCLQAIVGARLKRPHRRPRHPHHRRSPPSSMATLTDSHHSSARDRSRDLGAVLPFLLRAAAKLPTAPWLACYKTTM
jgi:hypothetical protein